LGYVAQEVAIDKILTGRELLQLQGDLYHLAPAARNRRMDELIELLGMTDWIDRRCGSYSGGMRRRLDLAAGLLHSPKVLVLDEPTVGLDIESRAAIWSVLRQLREGGTTVLLSSHYLEEVDALADHLAIIEAGKVIAEGAPAVLKAALGGDRVTLRVREFSDADEAERVRSLLHDCAGVRQVVVNRAQGYSLNLVIEHDGVIFGCAALYPFPAEKMAEMACLTVSPDSQAQGDGERLLKHLETRARAAGFRQLFVLTTRAAHWFLKRGFVMASIDDLPKDRQNMYNWQRKSMVLIKKL
jgi:ABC-type multidrug transport system ATPase subunit